MDAYIEDIIRRSYHGSSVQTPHEIYQQQDSVMWLLDPNNDGSLNIIEPIDGNLVVYDKKDNSYTIKGRLVGTLMEEITTGPAEKPRIFLENMKPVLFVGYYRADDVMVPLYIPGMHCREAVA
jgi:hypothetical protein